MLNRVHRMIFSCLLAGLLLFLNCYHVASATAEPPEHAEKLDFLAEQFYQLVNEGKLEQAHAKINEIHKQVTHIHFQSITTAEGVEALMETVIHAKQILAGLSPSQHEATIAAAKLRLAIDALTHPNQPMWHHYYKIMQEDGQKLTNELALNNQEKIQQAIKEIHLHFDMIRAAVLLNRQPYEVEKMDSLLKLLQRNPKQAMQQYEQLINELFGRKTSTAYLPINQPDRNLMILSAIIGAMIIATLTYVGWRKYRAERNVL